jgi:hypothetical protein
MELPDCVHCGGGDTYVRESDGGIACHDCPGIMPSEGHVYVVVVPHPGKELIVEVYDVPDVAEANAEEIVAASEMPLTPRIMQRPVWSE